MHGRRRNGLGAAAFVGATDPCGVDYPESTRLLTNLSATPLRESSADSNGGANSTQKSRRCQHQDVFRLTHHHSLHLLRLQDRSTPRLFLRYLHHTIIPMPRCRPHAPGSYTTSPPRSPELPYRRQRRLHGGSLGFDVEADRLLNSVPRPC